MLPFPESLQKLIKEFSKLPSVGEKSATRFAHFLISQNRDLGKTLAQALNKTMDEVRLCDCCFFFSDKEKCPICLSTSRDRSILCIVEKPMDVVAIERVGEYRGVYHVLHGLWAPLKGQGPEQMKLKELVSRASSGEIREAILATGCTVEGDATALYIARVLKEFNIKTTRLAQGMPKGGELEYADDLTLSRAISGRNIINP